MSINPDQIRPFATSGTLVGTANGVSTGMTITAGTGISVTISGTIITISTSGAFAINSFTGGSVVEIGTSITNPAFAATYTSTPASANITNTDGISSPTSLTTPFTSGTVTGTFLHTTTTTTTFTLSATSGTTATATQTIQWEPSIFGGVGSSGATSSVTASGTTAVLSTGSVLPRTQLGAEVAGPLGTGTVFNVSPSNQVVYLLLTGGSHTFVDNNTGFPFVMNAPLTVTFVNAQGTTITMYLYASTNALFVPFAVRVAS